MIISSVVLDACVLIPPYLRDTLLTTAKADLYIPFWSQKILDETMRNIVRIAKDVSVEQMINLENIMKAAFPEARTFLELLHKLSKQIPRFTKQLILYEYSENRY